MLFRKVLRFANAIKRRRPNLIIRLIFATGLAIGLSCHAVAADSDLTTKIDLLASECQAMLQVAKTDQTLGVVLGKSGETWGAVADSLAIIHGQVEARNFIDKALAAYQANMTRTQDQLQVQLAGMNLLFQAVDVLALTMATLNNNVRIQRLVRDTEQKTLEIVNQAGTSLPALAVISGSTLTLMALILEQLDRQGQMSDQLIAELDKRRSVDSTIANRKEIMPAERFLLLTNNHIQGMISMIQMIGLLINPGLKPKLAVLEEGMIKVKDDGLEVQVLTGAKTLAETGFIVAPVFNGKDIVINNNR
ncbi:MAG: hypothetical protein HQK55_07385 [Deltaproteobacteria bacterium]|nr:hypothetical protein [Deltaproteobacteria bacterium]